MNLLKDGISKILTKTELQRKLKEATSNEHCHANVSLLDEIAGKTSNYNDFQQIVAHCIKKLGAKKEKWRKILKTLFLIEHILKVGSPNFYDSMKSESYNIKNLNNFSFIDPNKVDKGETIRQKSKEILVLLNDKAKLRSERENYAKWKGRIEGVSSSGKIGSVSSSNYTNSVSSYNYDRNYGSTTNNTKKETVKESESESSEDSEEEKKTKKGKFKKTKEEVTEKNNDDEYSIKSTLKPSASSNISIKKPSAPKKETQETFNPFESAPLTTKQGVSDINDIFGTSISNQIKPANNTNSKSNSDNIIDFISFTDTNNAMTKPSTTNNLSNNPFNLDFDLTQKKPSINTNNFPDINLIPGNTTNTAPVINNPPKLETNELLKMMYSDNSSNRPNPGYQQPNNFAFNPNNNPSNLIYQNQAKQQVNPLDFQFNNLNINSSNANLNQTQWNNNSQSNIYWAHNYNNPNPQGYNYNYNAGNNLHGVGAFNNPNISNNNNNQKGNNGTGVNNQTFNFVNNSGNNQSKFNDDDFKEVEEDPFKNENTTSNKGKGLNNLLDNKLVDLSNLKGDNKKTQSNNSNNNFNFYY